MSFLADPEKSIFSVLVGLLGRGTAIAISEELLITCQHVVTDAKEVALFSHHPISEGETVVEKRKATGKVIATDEKLDLALLRSSSRLPFSLELEDKEDLDDSMPLRIWSWPGWNAWMEDFGKGIVQDPSSSTFAPTPHAAVMTHSWTEEESNTLRFSFAGRIEGGMSGGPVVSARNNKNVGIITADWNVDPEAILDSSYLGSDSCCDEESQRWFERVGEKMRAAVIAQLDLGMGIAISLKDLKAFLDSKAPEVL